MARYLQPLAKEGMETPAKFIEFLGVPFPKVGTIKKSHIVENCKVLLEYCDTIGITSLLVTDAKHFCYLSGKTKAEDYIGNIYNCVISGYEHISILPAISPVVVQITPAKGVIFNRALTTLVNHVRGTYTAPGLDVIRDAKYPRTVTEIRDILKNDYVHRNVLGIDIETYGLPETSHALRWERGELGTIAFSPDKHTGTAFCVGEYFDRDNSDTIKKILKGMFDNFKGTKVLHNGLFDAKFLIRHLYMKDLDDYKGMYEGIKVFSDMDDTMLMAYCCINSTERLPKGLKELSKEFTGDYAEDVKDIKKLNIDDLLKYNLMDTCGTMYLYEKYNAMLDVEEQREFYENIIKPSIPFLLEMMLTGLPIDYERTLEAREELTKTQEEALSVILNSEYVKRAEAVLKRLESDKYNATHKTKKKNPDEIELTFNPGSGNQLRILLLDILKYDVIEKTETGLPAVGGAIIKEYLAMAKYNQEDDVVELLQAILDFGAAIKVNGTFIEALLGLSVKHTDNMYTLHGDLKLGGTQSFRISSANPNLQNLPSGSIYGKLIKSCVVAPKGWLFASSDFSALEDVVSSILSNDYNKKREFSQKLDGLR